MRYTFFAGAVLCLNFLLCDVSMAATCPAPAVVKKAIQDKAIYIRDGRLRYDITQGYDSTASEISFHRAVRAAPFFRAFNVLSCFYTQNSGESINLSLIGTYQISLNQPAAWVGISGANAEFFACYESLSACGFNLN